MWPNNSAERREEKKIAPKCIIWKGREWKHSKDEMYNSYCAYQYRATDSTHIESERSRVSLYRYYLLNYITLWVSVVLSLSPSMSTIFHSLFHRVYRHKNTIKAHTFTQTFIACLVSGRRWALAADSQHATQRPRTIYTFHDISSLLFSLFCCCCCFFLRAYVLILCDSVGAHTILNCWMCARKKRKRKKYK